MQDTFTCITCEMTFKKKLQKKKKKCQRKIKKKKNLGKIKFG